MKLIILIALLGAIVGIVAFFVYPKMRYEEEIRSLVEFIYTIGPNKKTTSSSNALSAYRELMEKGFLLHPVVLRKETNRIYSEFKEKYPIRCNGIELKEFNMDHPYTLVLEGLSNSTVYEWDWDSINSFDPKKERALMTKALRQQIKVRDNYTCRYCHRVMKDDRPGEIHIDHIIPVAKGGKTTPRNLQVLCASCNLTKSDKM